MRMMYTLIVDTLRETGLLDSKPTDYLSFYCLGARETKKPGEPEPLEPPSTKTSQVSTIQLWLYCSLENNDFDCCIRSLSAHFFWYWMWDKKSHKLWSIGLWKLNFFTFGWYIQRMTSTWFPRKLRGSTIWDRNSTWMGDLPSTWFSVHPTIYGLPDHRGRIWMNHIFSANLVET